MLGTDSHYSKKNLHKKGPKLERNTNKKALWGEKGGSHRNVTDCMPGLFVDLLSYAGSK